MAKPSNVARSSTISRRPLPSTRVPGKTNPSNAPGFSPPNTPGPEGQPSDDKIKLSQIDRPCSGSFDLSQLALQQVDRTTHFYSHKLIHLADSDVTYDPTPWDVDSHPVFTYSLALLLRYRQNWVPKGYGLGEIIYSISLLPNEETTLEVKTWETGKTSTEAGDDIESRNVSDVSAEQSDVSEIVDEMKSKENFHADAKGDVSWGFGSASASTGYASEAEDHHKATSGQQRKAAQKAVNERTQKRSLRMAASRETGREDKTTRKIKNINQTHTLNVNFYQLLKQFEVSLELYEVNLVLLGQPFVRTEFRPSYEQFSCHVNQSLLTYSLTGDPLRFRQLMLQNTMPLQELSEEPILFQSPCPLYRYAFQINAGKERNLLYSLWGIPIPPVRPNSTTPALHMRVIKPGVRVAKTDGGAFVAGVTHFLYDVKPSAAAAKVKSTIDRILGDLEAMRGGHLGTIKGSEWVATLPTHGVYAETMLGRCSGGEDYIEISRQYDLDAKRLEIEKLKLDVEKLRLENQLLAQGQPPSSLVVQNAPEKTAVKLELGPGNLPGKVEFRS